jgi:hypothetical protein
MTKIAPSNLALTSIVTPRRRDDPLFGCARGIEGLDRGHIDRD